MNVATPPDALAAEGLDVCYRVRGRDRVVLRGLDFRIRRGESFGLVGESGCGKSTVALAATRYLPRNGRVSGGRVLIDGRDVLELDNAELRRLRAHSVAMVYQEPAKALNPSMPIGRQVAEVFEVLGSPRREALEKARAMLGRVRIADPASVMVRYPHQLSGGMQQRVVIALALAIRPSLLILDEPTTGLDATVEAEILDLIEQLRREYSTAVLFISHNLGVIAGMCDRVGVLYAGRMVEEGPTRAIFEDPRHPYTVGLLRCLPRRGRSKAQGRLDTIPGQLPPIGAQITGCIFAPRCVLADDLCRAVDPPPVRLSDGRVSACHHHERAPDLPTTAPPARRPAVLVDQAAVPVLSLDHVSKSFGGGAVTVRAVTDVSLELWAGETLGLVGESGSGKTTLARMILGLTGPDAGSELRINGRALASHAFQRHAAHRKSLQIIFQNPDTALNRARLIRRLISRALGKLAGLAGAERLERLHALIALVRLGERHLDVRPRQLSGGLKQRVAIALAFAGDPRVVVCDEPTSALDVSVQAAILNLLADLQAERQVSYVFISHDLGVVRYLSDRIAVLYLGRLMEFGPAEAVFSGPHHPYTEALLSAVPSVEGGRPERIALRGEIPSPVRPPSGCVFHTRCPRKIGAICERDVPQLREIAPGHSLRCHLHLDELGGAQAPAAADQASVS